jgi:hypothetical protein
MRLSNETWAHVMAVGSINAAPTPRPKKRAPLLLVWLGWAMVAWTLFLVIGWAAWTMVAR